MNKYKCLVAQDGFFAGPVFNIDSDFLINETTDNTPEEELRKFKTVKNVLVSHIQDRIRTGDNDEIYETVLSILEDPAFNKKTEEYLNTGNCSAEKAVIKASKELSEQFQGVKSEYISGRKTDIEGVASKLIEVMTGKGERLRSGSAIVSEEISPAQLASMDGSLIGALISKKGSPDSHVAIMAGNLGIPYLYGSSDAVSGTREAEFVIVDGHRGFVFTDPCEEDRIRALKIMEKIRKEKKDDKKKCNSGNNVTTVHCRTKVCANISGPEDIKELLESGADGVGLFRTELMFLSSEEMPTEEEQYNAYRSVLEAMGEKEVIIRTMDIGSDKMPKWLKLPEESNPALGLRGVRVSLEYPEMFRTQMRALLRAGTVGNLTVIFPMITSENEIDEIKEIINEIAEELKKEGKEYCVPKTGIMAETPATVLCAGELASKVDYISIGTNDLTQYTLAVDREAQGMDRFFEPYHESIFRSIRMISRGAHGAGIICGVCGRLAADERAVKRLIEEGVDELSVPVAKVGIIKNVVANCEAEIKAEDSSKRSTTKIEKTGSSKERTVPQITAVADGEVVPMEEIPDPVFAGGTMGKCVGILPENGKIYSPVSGIVNSIAETGHAITIKSDEGFNILVHAGIDTVNLGNAAFTHYVKEGEHVCSNQLLMESNLKQIKDAGYSPMIIVAVLE